MGIQFFPKSIFYYWEDQIVSLLYYIKMINYTDLNLNVKNIEFLVFTTFVINLFLYNAKWTC